MTGAETPVIYDHFSSKRELHERLLERTRDELLQMWTTALAGTESPAVRIPRSIEAWAAYVEAHPFAARMYFRESSGEPEVEAAHRRIHDQARTALTAIVAGLPGAGAYGDSLEMAAEIIRSGLTGLAVWWSRHPEVPRAEIVRIAIAVLWTGLERVGDTNDPDSKAR